MAWNSIIPRRVTHRSRPPTVFNPPFFLFLCEEEVARFIFFSVLLPMILHASVQNYFQYLNFIFNKLCSSDEVQLSTGEERLVGPQLVKLEQIFLCKVRMTGYETVAMLFSQ